MLDNSSFIIIYDNTSTCKVKFITDSVVDVLGWEPMELIGKPVFSLFDSKEIPALHQIHTSNVMNEKLCSMTSYRYLHKSGHFCKIQTVVHYCYSDLVTVNFLYDPNSLGHKQRMNSVDEAFEINEDGELQLVSTGSFPWRPKDLKDSMKHSLMVSTSWNMDRITHQQEPRFFILLNRYSELLTITYVSEMVTELLGIRPADVLGKSVYQVVHPNDRAVVEAQCNSAKSHYVTCRIRFDWLVVEEKEKLQPVDSVVSGSTDGLVLVIRLAQKPVQL
ncbi:hypothetical protein BC941DRAFT_421531 [Chlamydoabsidia padenii]|nr:hypothetical protein BC941DRAFT_421531 [Chlamydoabsidia padenii]